MRRRKYARKRSNRSNSKEWMTAFTIFTALIAIEVAGEAIEKSAWVLLGIPIGLSAYGYKRYAKWRGIQEERRRVLLSGIDEVDHMSGYQFEERLAIHFRELGWDVFLTKKSGDSGADLVATDPRGTKWAIQAKCYAKPVGVHAVYEVLGGKAAYEATRALVVTNRKLTRSAKELAKKAGVEVWEREQLIHAFSDVAKKMV